MHCVVGAPSFYGKLVEIRGFWIHLTRGQLRMQSGWRFLSGWRYGFMEAFVLGILASGGVSAQVDNGIVLNRPRDEDRAVRFGISVGLNTMDFRALSTGETYKDADGNPYRYYAATRGLHPGFNVNALVRFRFNDNIHLRLLPGINFGHRDLYLYYADGPQRGEEAVKLQFESSYIEMPVLLFFSANRHNNARPYVVVGVNPRSDMSAFKKLKIEHNQLLRLQKFDVAYEVGFGYEFYFQYFKMAPEIKWSGGFLNTLSRDHAEGAEAYRGAIKSLTSQIFVFSLIFE